MVHSFFFICRLNSPIEENRICCEEMNDKILHGEDCEICRKYNSYFNITE